MTVSALIPTYNRRKYIFRAIDSVLAQTVPVDEIIVVDDGSSDNTLEAIQNHYGLRVKVFSQGNSGVSAARKRAVDEAQGEWIAFLDSDDEWLPERNAALLKAVSMVPQKVALIFGNSLFIADEGESGTVFESNGLVPTGDPLILNEPLSELNWEMGRSRPCVLESSFIRRSVLMELGCFSEGLKHSEDYLAGFQIATKYPLAAIPSVVTKIYRTSDLAESCLEPKWDSFEDHARASMIGYAGAAATTGGKHWRYLYENSVRALCKWRARHDLPIRRLAWYQFRFGVSPRSVAFICGALLGTRFFRAGFATKRKLKALCHQPNRT